VASYHFGRDALRVTVDETQDNRPGKRVSSEGSEWRRHHRDRGRKIGIDRDSAGRMAGIIFLDGHNISAEEYAKVKEHAIAGFRALRGLHAFTALCAGLHHNLYKAGYGLTLEDFPKDWSLATIKKVLEISAVISVCDFIDAFTHRATKILDGSAGPDLRTMLVQKYPDDVLIVDLALMANEEMKL